MRVLNVGSIRCFLLKDGTFQYPKATLDSEQTKAILGDLPEEVPIPYTAMLLDNGTQRRLLGVSGHDLDTPEVTVLVQQIDATPVGDTLHDQPGHARQRLLVVERRRQHHARLSQEPLFIFDPSSFGDVL